MSASENSGVRLIADRADARDTGHVADSSTRSTTDRIVGDGDHGQPSWARWKDELDARYTLGVEEELMLLEPSDWTLAQSSDAVIAGLSDELSAHTSPETHASVVELATGVHQDVDGVVAELSLLRSRLSSELDALGLAVAARARTR